MRVRAPTGGMAEWSMAAVLKTVGSERGPGVRIPLPPPAFARRSLRSRLRLASPTRRSLRSRLRLASPTRRSLRSRVSPPAPAAPHPARPRSLRQSSGDGTVVVRAPPRTDRAGPGDRGVHRPVVQVRAGVCTVTTEPVDSLASARRTSHVARRTSHSAQKHSARSTQPPRTRARRTVHRAREHLAPSPPHPARATSLRTSSPPSAAPRAATRA